jgi:hypothetical protein
MTTSGTYTFTITRDDIIREAMLNIGKLGSTATPSAQETTDCARKLNMIVKQWMGRQDYAPGLKMWTRVRGDLFLSSTQSVYALGPSGDNWAGGVATSLQKNTPNYNTATLLAAAAGGTNSFSVGTTAIAGIAVNDFVVVQLTSGDIFSSTVATRNAGAGTLTTAANLPSGTGIGAFLWNFTTKAQRPLLLNTAVLRDSNLNDTPLNFMTVETFEALPNKAMPTFTSDPTAMYYESQLTNGQLYLDAFPQDVTKLIHVVFLRPTQDFNNPLDNPDFPIQWGAALCWELSKQIAPMFNALWTNEMESNYKMALVLPMRADAETSEAYFQVNAD